MNLKAFLAEQQFRYDLGLKIFNQVRTILTIIIMINTFLMVFNPSRKIIFITYGIAVVFGTVGIWGLGYILDKANMQFYFDQAYFDRGKTRRKLDEMSQPHVDAEKQGI